MPMRWERGREYHLFTFHRNSNLVQLPWAMRMEVPRKTRDRTMSWSKYTTLEDVPI